MSTKELQTALVTTMKNWMKIENLSVTSTSAVLEKTENPVLRAVMEIIQADSQRHHHIQELIVRTLETEAVKLDTDELVDIWDMIERHIAIEKKTVELAEEALGALKGRKMVVQEYLIRYLLEDENKHNHLLEQLSVIKKGMYPYG